MSSSTTTTPLPLPTKAPHHQKQIFLITGSSSGLGTSLVKAVLASGHVAIATARNLSKIPAPIRAEIENLGGTWLELDVTENEESLREKVEDVVVKRWGGVDVLVNNAGFALSGTVEDSSLEAIHSLFETNFFGPLKLIKILTPIMRVQATGGTIVNISSGSCVKALPTLGPYGASKCAIEGLSESLAQELSSQNIRTILAVPGDMRTNFASPARLTTNVIPLSSPYLGTPVEQVASYLVNNLHGGQNIDPERAALRIVERVLGQGEGAEGVKGKGEEEKELRLLLGSETGTHFRERLEHLGKVVEGQEGVWRSVDF